MKKGLSLHIGLNYVDPNHYSGWDGKLQSCEYDANDMKSIADNMGFSSKQLLRNDATRENVINEIKKAAATLSANDIFFMSYSGHGGQVPDMNSDEVDNQDETWCLFDGQLIDDELKSLWTLFKEGVRILVISDSCHSGTIIKEIGNENIKYTEKSTKYAPSEIAATTYFGNKEFYDNIIGSLEKVDGKSIGATVKLISGCQDNQYSYDGTFNGQFTGKLKRVWNGGKFNGSYYEFYKAIMLALPQYQTPNYTTIGKFNSEFDDEKPFTI